MCIRDSAANKDHGVFVTQSRVVKLDADDNYDCVSQCDSGSNFSSPSTAARATTSRAASTTPTARIRRSLSMKHHETKSASVSVAGSSRAPSSTFSR